MQVIGFNALKGGTGKSTLCVATLNLLSNSGFKCLAIDMDSVNHSLSFYYNVGIPFETIQKKNIFKVFTGESIKENVLTVNDNLDLLHAHISMYEVKSIDSFKVLKKHLRAIESDYDYVLIDTGPTYDNLIANVFKACDILIIPTIPDMFNYQSLKYLFDKLTELALTTLDIHILFNQYEKPRTENKKTFSNQVIDLFQDDEQINSFICPKKISKSNVMKKYANKSSFKINIRKSTEKQFLEMQDLIKYILKIPLSCAAF